MSATTQQSQPPAAPERAPQELAAAQARITVTAPEDGGQLTGLTTFKATLIDAPADGYSMFWQVDDGQVNPMNDSPDAGTHKQADVDVTTWTWRGTGPYVVRFIAQDATGKTIGETSVKIFVAAP